MTHTYRKTASERTSRVVFLTAENPFPPRGGGALRDASLIRALRELAEVEVLCFGDSSVRDSTVEASPVTQVRRERRPFWERAIYPLRSYVLNGFSRQMTLALESAAVRLGSEPRILWISRLAMAQYANLGRRLGFRVVLDEHNVESELLKRMALSSPRYWLELRKVVPLRRAEARFCSQADAVIATSRADARLLEALLGPSAAREIRVLPNTVDFEHYAKTGESLRPEPILLFTGRLDYEPNVQGLLWFASEILPRLTGLKAKVVVAGGNPSSALRVRLETCGIEVQADPPSLLPLLSRSLALFVPLLSGSGTRLKIIEALACGLPVVTTSKGSEGLDAVSGEHLLVGDGAQAFADRIREIFTDPVLAARIGSSGQRFGRDRYDWRTLLPELRALIRHLEGLT